MCIFCTLWEYWIDFIIFFNTSLNSTIWLPEPKAFQFAIHHPDQCKMLNIQIKLELFFYE